MKAVAVVLAVLVGALVGSLTLRNAIAEDEDKLVIVHWSNSHPMRDGLLPEMAAEFNEAGHETGSGKKIEVVLVQCDSAVQADDLVARVNGAGEAENACESHSGGSAADPVIVTPQSADWLVDINHRARNTVVALDDTESIAETWLGIVTYRAMADCLGWPDEDIGYAEILELARDPDGWEAYSPCSSVEWGRQPLLAFTNPATSTSGRNVLVSLYSIAAGKSPDQLTVADIERPEVVEFVKEFQGLVDHYMPGTIPLNTKIAQGTRYGHFFLMPEDNLVSMYQGNEKAIAVDGTEQPVPPVDDLVMIYPKEGSVRNSNPAGIVDARWVTVEERGAARDWVDFLREDEQQQTLMDSGFRPTSGSQLSVDARQFAEWGLDADPPQTIIEPGDLDPAVLEGIIGSWGAVKNPAIVTFVVDVSGSMEGEPLQQVKDGLNTLLDAMAGKDDTETTNQVGLVTFSSTILTEIAPVPLSESRYDIGDAITQMEAAGATALYDAVARAVELTDDAVGDPRATRAVVVLSDGLATEGSCLNSIVAMSSRSEVPVSAFCGIEGDEPIADNGERISIEDVVGEELRMPHDNDVQVFFVGFGEADVNIGRILAQATGAEYQGSTEQDLAAVIEELSGYF